MQSVKQSGVSKWLRMHLSGDHQRTIKSLGHGQLTKEDIQHLLNISRAVLAYSTEDKLFWKELASEQWELSRKDDPSTAENFKNFSRFSSHYRLSKKQEKVYASIIGKLKGMR